MADIVMETPFSARLRRSFTFSGLVLNNEQQLKSWLPIVVFIRETRDSPVAKSGWE
jgi:hypothetical protein